MKNDQNEKKNTGSILSPASKPFVHRFQCNNLGRVTHAAKENDTAIRHFTGQLLHLLCSCKMRFSEMHHFGSSECFSNVLIKVCPRCSAPLSRSLVFKSKHFGGTQRKCLVVEFRVISPLPESHTLPPLRLREDSTVLCCP